MLDLPTLPTALLPSLFLPHSVYLGCAAVGGVVLGVQLLLLLLGGDVADGDMDADVDSDGLTFFSVRAIASFLTFFGLVGLYGEQAGWSGPLTGGAAFGAGLGMMAIVAWIVSLQSKLDQEGTMDPKGAVGASATCYLRIPADGEGKGKITVALQGRTAEFAAITQGPEIPTGADVLVVRMVNESTFEVERN